MYMVDPTNSSVLRGSRDAEPPAPADLYIESVNLDVPNAPKTWTPNIASIDAKLYRAHQVMESHDLVTSSAFNNLSKAEQDRHKRTSELLLGKLDKERKSGTNLQGYAPEIGKRVKEILGQDVLPRINKNIKDRVAKMGIVTPNDCTRFATSMKNLLTFHKMGTKVERHQELSLADAKEMSNLEVGDMIVLVYPTGGRHGITCVAVDKAKKEFVTLEAHASRYLTQPEFHLYGSMRDLVDKQFSPDAQRQPKSSLSRMPAQMPPGMEEKGCTVESMKDSATQLARLVKGKNYKDIWTYGASVRALPCLFT